MRPSRFLEDTKPKFSFQKLLYIQVDPRGPCHGLVRQGDSIVKVDGVPILSAKQLKKSILGPPGSEMFLTFFQVRACTRVSVVVQGSNSSFNFDAFCVRCIG